MKLFSMLHLTPARTREGLKSIETHGRSLEAARHVGLALVACLAAAVNVVATTAGPPRLAGANAEVQLSSFSLRPSAFSLRPSAFSLRPSAFSLFLIQGFSAFSQTSSPTQLDRVVTGTVLNANGTPHPAGLVVLRRVEDGKEAERVKTDSNGAFRLGVATDGIFLIELRSPRDQVLAVSDPIEIGGGPIPAVAVRLRADVPWFGRSFGNTAAAAVAAAAAHGITAVGSSGLPASPQ